MSQDSNYDKDGLYCMKKGHNKQLIQSICLNTQCKDNRPMCKNCFFEHRLHLISTLNGQQFDPLRIFSINSNQPHSEKYLNEYRTRYQNINNNLIKKIQSNFDQKFKYHIQQVYNQFQAIWETFDPQTSLETAKKIKNNINNPVSKEFIQTKIKMLFKLASINKTIDICDGQCVNRIVDYHQSAIKHITDKAFNSISQSLRVMKEQLQSLKLQNIDFAKVIDQQKKSILSDTQVFKQDKIQISLKREKNQKKLQKIQKVQKSQKSQKIAKNQKIQKGQRNQKNNIVIINSFKKQKNQDNIQGVKRKRQKKVIQHYEQSKINHEYTVNEDKVLTINNFELNKLPQICQIIRNQKTTHLSLIVNCKPNQILDKCVQKISQFKSLKSIKLQWANSISKQSIIELVNKLNLTQLSIQNCNSFDQECIDLIIEKLPKISVLNYGVDFRNSLQKYHQSLYFMQQQCDESLSIECCAKLVTLKKLTNIWLGKCVDKESSRIIQNMKQLLDVVLGEFVEAGKKIRPQTIEFLKQYTDLRSISMINIDNCHLLKKNIMNYSKLDTLVFVGCKGIDDQLINMVYDNCKELRQLSLDTCDVKIGGIGIWQMQKLQTLIISKGIGLDKQAAIEGLPSLKNLQFIDFRQNQWVDDEVMVAISGLKNILYLSIAVTYVTDEGINSITSLTNLQTLICGHTRINGTSIVKLTNYTKNLKKLSIAGLDGNGQYGFVSKLDMDKLANNVSITHLNIYKCEQFEDDTILIFPNLVCVTLYGSKVSEKCKDELRQKGTYVQDKQ